MQLKSSERVPPVKDTSFGRLSSPTRFWVVMLVLLTITVVGAHLLAMRGALALRSQRDRWEAARQERTDLMAEWKSRQAQIKSERRRVSTELSVQQEELTTVANTLASKKAGLKRAVESRDEAFKQEHAARADYHMHLEETLRLQKKLADLRSARTVLDTSIRSLEDDQDRLRNSHNSLAVSLELRRGNIKKAREELDRLDAERQRLRNDIAKLDQELSDARQIETRLKAQLARAARDTGRLKEDRKKLLQSSHELKQETVELEARANELRRAVAADQAEQANLSASVERAQRRLKSLQDQVAERRGELGSLTETRATVSKELVRLRAERSQVAGTLTTRGRVKDELFAESARRTDELAAVEKRISRLKVQERALLDSVRELTKMTARKQPEADSE